MSTLPTHEIFHAARVAAAELAAFRGRSPNAADIDILSAIVLLIHGSRLTASIATAQNLDRKPPHQWRSIVEEVYAVRLEDGCLWTLDGPVEECPWREQARKQLHVRLLALNCPPVSDIKVELSPLVDVDAFDPLVIEAMSFIRPRYQAIVSHARLHAHTPPAPQGRARRL